MVILINIGKEINENQHLIMINSFSKLEIERHFPNLEKSTCKSSVANVVIQNKTLNILTQDCQGRDACSHHLYSALY